MYKDSSKQSHWSIIIAIAVLIMLPLVNISYKKYKRATEEAHMHKLVRVQNQEADVLVEIIDNLKLNLRTVAYHQAITEMEHAFPIEYRDKFTAEEWENMISEKTDEILEEATTVQLNSNFRLPPYSN